MKIEYVLLAVLIVITAILAAMVGYIVGKTDKSSSFVGYSQSCWQVGDTMTVITAKGDTVKLNVSKLEGGEMRLTTQIRDGYTVVTREYPMAGCYETYCMGLEEELGEILATTESKAKEAHEDMIDNVKIWLEADNG